MILVGNKSDLAPDSLVSDPAPGPADGSGEGTTNGQGKGRPTGSGRDVPNNRAVTKDEATEWCKRNGVMQYVETSAKSGEGVERAFLEVAERIYQNIEAGRYDLNDRRSGVKGPGAGTRREGGPGQGRAVVLGMNEVGGMGKGSGGGCC